MSQNNKSIKNKKRMLAFSARKRNLECNLTNKDIRRFFKTKICPFTGYPLNKDNRSVDRIDNSKGYTSSNTVACHRKFNMNLKADLELEEIKALYSLTVICGIKPSSKRYERFRNPSNVDKLEDMYRVLKQQGFI